MAEKADLNRENQLFYRNLVIFGTCLAVPTLIFVISSLFRVLHGWTSFSCTTDSLDNIICTPESFSLDITIITWLLGPMIVGIGLLLIAVWEYMVMQNPSPHKPDENRGKSYLLLVLITISLPYLVLGIAGSVLVEPFAECTESMRFISCKLDLAYAFYGMDIVGALLLIIGSIGAIDLIRKSRRWRMGLRRRRIRF